MVAPTEAAAVNIGAETIRSALKLLTQASKFKDLVQSSSESCKSRLPAYDF